MNVDNKENDLPIFKYFPNPVACGAFEKAKKGRTVICPCCGRATEYYYHSMIYAVEDVEHICPECISSGAAAEKYDGGFIQDAEYVSDPNKTKELQERTPGYVSWQGEYWLAHCDDYMEYLGDVGVQELTEMGILDEVLAEYATHDAYDVKEVRQYLEKEGSMAGYLFRCLHCGAYRIWVDAD